METNRNRAKVMAIALRAATNMLRGELSDAESALLDAVRAEQLVASVDNAIESIDVVAEELEQIAAEPKAEAAPSTPRVPQFHGDYRCTCGHLAAWHPRGYCTMRGCPCMDLALEATNTAPDPAGGSRA